MNEPADVQQTFSLAEVFDTQRFSKLESLLDIHLKTTLINESAPKAHTCRYRCGE